MEQKISGEERNRLMTGWVETEYNDFTEFIYVSRGHRVASVEVSLGGMDVSIGGYNRSAIAYEFVERFHPILDTSRQARATKIENLKRRIEHWAAKVEEEGKKAGAGYHNFKFSGQVWYKGEFPESPMYILYRTPFGENGDDLNVLVNSTTLDDEELIRIHVSSIDEVCSMVPCLKKMCMEALQKRNAKVDK